MDASGNASMSVMSTPVNSVIRISSLARKFRAIFLTALKVFSVIILMDFSILGAFVGAHLGEPCNALLRVCLPPSPYIYCDANFTCRCKSHHPVEIQPHTCKAARKIGERCSYNEECSFLDINAHCAKEYDECQCLDGFRHSFVDERCVPGKSREHPHTRTTQKSFFPWSIIFFLACFGIICGISFVWYMFCSDKTRRFNENSSDDNQLDPLNGTTTRGRIADGHRRRGRPGGHRYNRNNRSPRSNGDSGGLGRSNDPPTSLLQLPSYKSALHYNQPPPSYDEAVRETTLEAVVVPEVVNYISDRTTNSIGPQAGFSSLASHGER